MVSPGAASAEWVLVVDPIDGTRPALAGLESCLRLGRRGAGSTASRRWATSRSAASSRSRAAPRFVAERGEGLEPAPRLSANTELGADVLDLRPARPAGAGADARCSPS